MRDSTVFSTRQPVEVAVENVINKLDKIQRHIKCRIDGLGVTYCRITYSTVFL